MRAPACIPLVESSSDLYIYIFFLFKLYNIDIFVNKESALLVLLAMETEYSGQGFTQIIPYPAGVTLPKLGNFTQAW